MSRFVSACLCAILACFSTAGMSFIGPASVRAAEGTLTVETPLHETPDHGSPLVALLGEGTVVTVDGPPVDGFYPVTTGSGTGWMRGETLALVKDIIEEPAELTQAEDGGGEMAPLAQETNDVPPPANTPAPPVDQTTAPAAGHEVSADPAQAGGLQADPAQPSETTTEPTQTGESIGDAAPAPEPTPDPSASSTSSGTDPAAADVWAEPAPVADDALAEPVPGEMGVEPAADSVDPNQLSPEPEVVVPAPVETTATDAAPPASAGTAAPATDSDPAAVAPAMNAPAAPAPAPTPEPLGPAGVAVDMPIRSGPGNDYGLIFTVPMGSTVEQTGQIVDGYISVRYKEVVGWAAAEHMTDPSDFATETPEEAVEPVDTKTPKPGSGVAFATIDLSLRSGPSANSEPIIVVPAGSRLILTGVMEGDFQRVTYGDEIGWIANEFLETPDNPAPNGEGKGKQENFSRREIVRYITQAAKRYDQSPEDMVRVAQCESNLDPYAVNPSGSYGLFQFIRSTWKSTPYGNEDIFDPQANSNAAAWMWSQGRKSEWVCQ